MQFVLGRTGKEDSGPAGKDRFMTEGFSLQRAARVDCLPVFDDAGSDFRRTNFHIFNLSFTYTFLEREEGIFYNNIKEDFLGGTD